MKNLLFVLLIIVVSISAACNNSSSFPADAADSAKERNDSFYTGASRDVTDFAVDAAAGGIKEIEFGKLALKKAIHSSIRRFAKMMIDDHTRLGDSLSLLAKQKEITIPGKPEKAVQASLDGFSTLKGNDFDKQYVKLMLQDHKETLDKFKKASAELKDTSLRRFALQAVPVIQMHLNAIDSIARATGYKPME